VEQLIHKIEEVLSSRDLEFSALAEHLGFEESELKKAFHENTVEIRTLEKISKELKIPLYRFFRDPVGNLLEAAKDSPAYSMVRAEELMRLQMQLNVALKEVSELRQLLAEKDEQIKEYQSKLKGI